MTIDEIRKQSDDKLWNLEKKCCANPKLSDFNYCTANEKICPPEQCSECEPSEACEFAQERSRCLNCGHTFIGD